MEHRADSPRRQDRCRTLGNTALSDRESHVIDCRGPSSSQLGCLCAMQGRPGTIARVSGAAYESAFAEGMHDPRAVLDAVR